VEESARGDKIDTSPSKAYNTTFVTLETLDDALCSVFQDTVSGPADLRTFENVGPQQGSEDNTGPYEVETLFRYQSLPFRRTRTGTGYDIGKKQSPDNKSITQTSQVHWKEEECQCADLSHCVGICHGPCGEWFAPDPGEVTRMVHMDLRKYKSQQMLCI